MSHTSKQRLRPMIALVLSLGLALPAVGGTMAQEEPDTRGADVTIEVTTPSSGRSGGADRDAISIVGCGIVIPASQGSNGALSFTLEIDPPGAVASNADLRGKILRITPIDDPSYSCD